MRKLTDLFSLTAILGVPVLVALLVPMLAVPQSAGAAGDAPGKAIFLAQKCNMCHNVPSEGIVRTTKSDKVAGPDVPGDLADKPASFFEQFLKKEVTNNEGEKHSKEWKGTDEELKTISAWMAGLE
jgi:hypothetical protein